MEPDDSTAYVPLSNIYVVANMWEYVVRVKKMMKYHGLKKELGKNKIDVNKSNNILYEFILDNSSHT